MAEQPYPFEKRTRRIDRAHRRMRTNGYSVYVGADGLIKRRPKAAPVRVPLGLVLVILAGFFLFKGAVIEQLGRETYLDRVAELAGGTIVERAGAWAMQVDPVSEFLAAQLAVFAG